VYATTVLLCRYYTRQVIADKLNASIACCPAFPQDFASVAALPEAGMRHKP